MVEQRRNGTMKEIKKHHAKSGTMEPIEEQQRNAKNKVKPSNESIALIPCELLKSLIIHKYTREHKPL